MLPLKKLDVKMAKKGDKYKCDDCGLVIVVEDPCGCTACDLICCGKQMKTVKPVAKKK